jgi:hypothetical protein
MRSVTTILSALVLVSGCTSTPTGNVEAFGSAAKGVTDKVDSVIEEYNNESVNNELNKLAQHRTPITTSSFDPARQAIIGQADRKRYALYKANHALGTYADALRQLARSGTRDEINLASTNLYSALNGFNEQYKTLQDTQDDLVDNETTASIGTIIAAAGGAYAEKTRSEAIKRIVIQADPYIQSIADVIVDELMKGVIEERLYTMKHTELSGYIKHYNSKVASTGFSERRAALADIYEQYLDMQSSSASVVQAVKAIKEIKAAHSTLKDVVAEDQFSSEALVNAIGRLRDMDSRYGDLEELMLSCETEIIADDDKGVICEQQ